MRALADRCDAMTRSCRHGRAPDLEFSLSEASHHLHQASIAMAETGSLWPSEPDGPLVVASLTAADFDQVFGLLGAVVELCDRSAASNGDRSAKSMTSELGEIRRRIGTASTVLRNTLDRGGIG